MKSTQKVPLIAILSAELSEERQKLLGITEKVNNKGRTELLRSMLDSLGASYKRMVGVYNGHEEVSYVVALDDVITEHTIASMASLMNQESYLVSNSNRTCKLVNPETGTSEVLQGTLRAVQPAIAQHMGNYTRELDHSAYYTIV